MRYVDPFGLDAFTEIGRVIANKLCVCRLLRMLENGQTAHLLEALMANVEFSGNLSVAGRPRTGDAGQNLEILKVRREYQQRLLDDLLSLGGQPGSVTDYGFALLARTACGEKVQVGLDSNTKKPFTDGDKVFLNPEKPLYGSFGSAWIEFLGGETVGRIVLAHELSHLFLEIDDPFNVYIYENRVRCELRLGKRVCQEMGIRDRPRVTTNGEVTGVYWPPRGLERDSGKIISGDKWFLMANQAREKAKRFLEVWGKCGCP
jgi:hypothetical protein